MGKFWFWLPLVAAQFQAFGATYYASPSSTGGAGTFADPWSLSAAVAASGTLLPGDVLYLRGGRYSACNTVFQFVGSAEDHIVVRSYPGEWARLTSGVFANGSHTTYRNFAVNCEPASRVSSQMLGTDLTAEVTFTLNGEDNDLINLVLSNGTIGGLHGYNASPDCDIYGCIVYYSGFDTSLLNDRPHGHNLYMQNSTGSKSVRNSVFHSSAHVNYNFYGSSAASLVNCSLIDSTVYGAGRLVGRAYGEASFAAGDSRNLTVGGNVFWKAAQNTGFVDFGLAVQTIYGCVVTNNIFAQLPRFAYVSDLVFTGNTLIRPPGQNMVIYFDLGSTVPAHVFDNNAYYSAGGDGLQLGLNGSIGTNHAFATWKTATGWDSNSTLTTSVSPPSPSVVVRVNEYESNEAYITILNWSDTSAVAVNVSGFLSSGMNYAIRNVEDYYGPQVGGRYNGSGTLSVPMTGWGVETPVGLPAPASSCPRFGVFVIKGTPRSQTVAANAQVSRLTIGGS